MSKVLVTWIDEFVEDFVGIRTSFDSNIELLGEVGDFAPRFGLLVRVSDWNSRRSDGMLENIEDSAPVVASCRTRVGVCRCLVENSWEAQFGIVTRQATTADVMLGWTDRNEAMFEDSWLEAWTDSLVLCLSFSNTGCQTEGIRKFESAVNARFGLFSDNCNILTSVDIHQVVVQSLVRFLALDVDNAGTSGRPRDEQGTVRRRSGSLRGPVCSWRVPWLWLWKGVAATCCSVNDTLLS